MLTRTLYVAENRTDKGKVDPDNLSQNLMVRRFRRPVETVVENIPDATRAQQRVKSATSARKRATTKRYADRRKGNSTTSKPAKIHTR